MRAFATFFWTAVIDLMRRVYQDFEYAPASTDISTPVIDVLRQRKGEISPVEDSFAALAQAIDGA